MSILDDLPAPLARRLPAIIAFAFGMLLPLVVAGALGTVYSGGLSDDAAPPAPSYTYE